MRTTQHAWNPCTRASDLASSPLPKVVGAQGLEIHLEGGDVWLDAIASWWCKSLGHRHPRLVESVQAQLNRFEHVIFANTTFEAAEHLSKRLAEWIGGDGKVCYAGDGASAVETALKLSLHTRMVRGEAERSQFAALSNGYHGETLGALSVTAAQGYRVPYRSMLFEPVWVEPFYSNPYEPLDHEALEAHWLAVQAMLEPLASTLTAIVLEPLVQGAGGLLFYPPEFLQRLVAWAHKHNVHVIADEIMTGVGRTGHGLACHRANVVPDMVCLSKGLTSGWLPFSAVVVKQALYDACAEVSSSSEPALAAFLHSHTYAGNPLGVVLANTTLDVMEEQAIGAHVQCLQRWMREAMADMAERWPDKLTNLRGVGGIVALDVNTTSPAFSEHMQQVAAKHGVLLRPIGKTLYWMPPLITDEVMVQHLADRTYRALKQVLQAV